MKTMRVVSVAGAVLVWAAGIFFDSTFISRAQMQMQPVQAQPDSVVQVVADAQGLSLVPPDQVPPDGTFWTVLPGPDGGITPPFPCPPLDPSLPIYAIADGQFLVDGTVGGQAALNTPQAGRLTASSTSEAALEAQADAVINLITQIQTAEANRQMRTMTRAMGMDVPSPGGDGSGDGGDGFSPMFSSTYTIDTNGLWLEITNVSNGWSYLNLHNATNQVYAIWSTTNLPVNWQVETEIWPTNGTVIPTVTPFTVQNFNRQNLFLRAEDWTGITSNGNTTPEWWFWKYFGTLNLSDTNLDSTGENTLLYYYQHGLDPNVIQFSLQFTNTDLNTTIAYGTITIQSGVPSYMALLVNNTNEAGAVWQPYSSTNVVVPLTSGNGLYNILVGLRGLPSDARQSWVQAQLTLNNVAPTLTVTNPTSSTVSVPMIQLQGYVSASLSKLTFDVSNAAGIFTNQQGYWQPAFYDTNLLAFTTNLFQCYDVTLTNGLNRITLHATDVTGNSTTTNFSYTLDYSGDHTAPVLSVIWPTNGTSIAGSNVTVQAQMDDVTATVTATVNSNIVAGLVERSGAVWFNNLPLNSGTNTVTITATDAAGNMSTTNLNVVQSTVSLTINPISSDQMNRTNITVSGTIGDSSEKVRVNGVLATVSGNNWTATHVPVSSTGTAGVNAQVTDSGNNPLAAQSVYQPQPAQVVLASYKKQEHDNYTSSFFISGLHIWETGPTETLDDAIYWSLNSGGAQHYDDDPHDIEDPPDIFNANYPAGANGFSAPWEYTSVTTNFDSLPVSSIEEYGNNYDHVETHVMIEPSGQQSVGQSILYLVQAQVTNEDTGLRLLASAVRFQNQLPGTTTVDVTDSDGSVWSQGLVSAPSGTTPEVTPLTFLPKVSFNTWQVTNMQLKIFAFTNGTAIDLSTNTPEFCVGQKVTFNAVWDYDPGAVSTNYIWAFSSTFVNHSSQASQYASTNWDIDSNIFTTNEPYAYWVSGGNKNVYLHEILHFSNGQNATVSASGQFSMYRPQTHVTTVTGTVAVDDNDILILTPIALHYGTPNDTPGITFSNMVAITNGSIKWLQVVNYGSEDLQRNDGSWIHEPIITNALDNSDPYPSYSDDINTTADSPGFGPSSPSQFQTLSRSNNFSMWLEFKPDGGIWVPLTGC